MHEHSTWLPLLPKAHMACLIFLLHHCQAQLYCFSDITFAILGYGTDGMSSHQLAQYLFLLSGLPLPPSLPTPDGLCNCRTPLSICFWLPSTPLFQVGWALMEERACKGVKFGIWDSPASKWLCSSDFTKTREYCCHLWWTPWNHQCCGSTPALWFHYWC